jgi:drug/metabolite transporter (DMT)-like permease
MFRTDKGRAVLALLTAALLFGATFVVVKSAVEEFPPIAFVAWRFTLGAVVLALFALPRGKRIWLHGSIAGVALFSGYALQTAGLTSTSASNSALITGLYVVITPFLAALLSRISPSWWTIGAAVLSFAGLSLLVGLDNFSLQRGDLLTIGAALSFAAHIVALARLAKYHPIIPFTTVQLVVTAVLAFAISFLIEGPELPPREVWGALALTGIGISVGAFVLQIWGQTIVTAGSAAVLLATESAFGVATGWLVLGERLSGTEWIGAGLIVAAIFVVVTKQKDPTTVEAEAVTAAH